MLRGFYTAASGMIAQQRKIDMSTNNLSNADTPGYKTDQSSLRAFPKMLMQYIDKQGTTGIGKASIGSLATGVYMQEATPLFKQGSLEETNNKTDLAIEDNSTDSTSKLFFPVQASDGTVKYTRDGNFSVDQQGYLTTASGNYVLDDNGNKIQVNGTDFSVNEDGQITSENGQAIARIGLSYAKDPNSLEKDGDGLYHLENNATLPNAYNQQNGFQIKQGYLESSNVDESQTMTDMMTAYRTFEANQKVVQAYDQSMNKAVNDVGRVNG
ncbi:flagellar hook-basal body protein [Heyndrickxia ginsengihumi]|uniref:Flagellar basal body rod protein FlgC n=1 Tax=Heyndrickxia ginsengihumi TaxID=363870 RepID=A0A0A6Y329_9BACI|nr:flagellar hook-basal body protein [Heyndrickxia ginsengihumi]KHD86677.1 flagellar basal body rod protein FlgC [Heyndrickxia ginsengihumi]MBE6184581.1 flagellar hook-basal body protein [Bacillus sp. (in: firmicutes)]MCM3022135.1 flagellar hook-basal body protein [Heyndrickxia ginsengihumi]NEY18366.1 flagellar hook-basal body protein [Heyndrickxia ginsengihumi]